MSSLRPTVCVASFEQITPDLLVESVDEEEVALLFDLDGTVIGHHDDRVPAKFLRAFERLGQDERVVAMVAVSNAGKKRFERAHSIVENQIAEAAGREVLCATSHEVGHFKPSRKMFLAAAKMAEVPLERTFYVGDQLYKDVRGAQRAGCAATALVSPYRVKSEHWFTHTVQRPFEALTRPMIGLPGRTADFGLPETSRYHAAKLISYGGAAVLAAAGAAGVIEYDQLAGGLYSLLTAGTLVDVGGVIGRQEREVRVDERFERLIEASRHIQEVSVTEAAETIEKAA